MSKAQDTSSLLEQITLAWWSERIDFFIRLKILVILGRHVSSPSSGTRNRQYLSDETQTTFDSFSFLKRSNNCLPTTRLPYEFSFVRLSKFRLTSISTTSSWYKQPSSSNLESIHVAASWATFLFSIRHWLQAVMRKVSTLQLFAWKPLATIPSYFTLEIQINFSHSHRRPSRFKFNLITHFILPGCTRYCTHANKKLMSIKKPL